MRFVVPGYKTDAVRQVRLERSDSGVTLIDSEGWNILELTDDGKVELFPDIGDEGVYQTDVDGYIKVTKGR